MHFKNLYRNLHREKNHYNKNSSPKKSNPGPSKLSMFEGVSSKLTFLVGLLIGISIISTTGFFVVLGRNLGDNDENGKVEVAGEVVNSNTNTAPIPSNTNTGPQVDTSKLSAVSDSDHIRGNKDASIVLIEYSDFQCPFCQRHHPTMQSMIDKYGDKIAWVYRHFPLTSIHPQAVPAAEAAECAGEQGKFWEYADKLFENQSSLAADYYSELATELGLDESKFSECLDSDKYLSLINKQAAEGQAAGARGTPATFINDQLVSGAVPLTQFEAIIDSML